MFKFKCFFLSLLALCCAVAHGEERVQIPILESFDGQKIELNAWLFLAQSNPSSSSSALQPAVILAHGCGGALDAKGQLSTRMIEYTQLLNKEGWHALVLDSFSARGVKQICTQPYTQRSITPKLRAKDVLDAHQWLSKRQDVDQNKIAYLGWSNGGSTVLAATNLSNSFVASYGLQPVAASVFYPGCVEDLRAGYRPSTQMLVQVGDSDDWTHPGPCKDMVRESAAPKPEIIAYEGAYHQFDSALPVKMRFDVGNKTGVHYGGNPEANLAAKKRLVEFLGSAFQNR